jgi:hypothetical protein
MPQPKDIAKCPIESCPWTLDIESSRTGVFTPVPDTETLFHDIAKRADSVIRAHLETHTLLEWVQEVTRLRNALDEATAENDDAPDAEQQES